MLFSVFDTLAVWLFLECLAPSSPLVLTAFQGIAPQSSIFSTGS